MYLHGYALMVAKIHNMTLMMMINIILMMMMIDMFMMHDILNT